MSSTNNVRCRANCKALKELAEIPAREPVLVQARAENRVTDAARFDLSELSLGDIRELLSSAIAFHVNRLNLGNCRPGDGRTLARLKRLEEAAEHRVNEFLPHLEHRDMLEIDEHAMELRQDIEIEDYQRQQAYKENQ